MTASDHLKHPKERAKEERNDFEKHPDCAVSCQYAKDIDMQGHSCSKECVYLNAQHRNWETFK